MEVQPTCGHPVTAVVSSGEGTCFCGMCEDQANSLHALLGINIAHAHRIGTEFRLEMVDFYSWPHNRYRRNEKARKAVWKALAKRHGKAAVFNRAAQINDIMNRIEKRICQM